jgi:predicted metal-dependent RNase
VVNIRGFSAHKDSDHLVEFVGTTKESLKKVIVVLGEPKSTYFLGQRIHEEYGVPVAVPEKNDILELP